LFILILICTAVIPKESFFFFGEDIEYEAFFW